MIAAVIVGILELLSAYAVHIGVIAIAIVLFVGWGRSGKRQAESEREQMRRSAERAQ